MRFNKKTILSGAALAVAALIISTGVYLAENSGKQPASEQRAGEPNAETGRCSHGKKRGIE